MFFPKITTDPHDEPGGSGSYNRITARRKNGDHVYIFGQTKRQCMAIKRLLMKLARHYDETMIKFADFFGVDEIAATNADLIECLSPVPDPYSGVNPHQALIAAMRDARICERILGQPNTIEQLLTVSNNQYDWGLFFRVNDERPEVRDLWARQLAEMKVWMDENRARLAPQRKADA
jgi:hypothetical protein